MVILLCGINWWGNSIEKEGGVITDTLITDILPKQQV